MPVYVVVVTSFQPNRAGLTTSVTRSRNIAQKAR
nr:MAG TPA: hypothetical protein [Caudoviricetes sp.]